MKPQARLDRQTVKEIERFLKDKHAQLKESVRSAMTQRSTNQAGRSSDSATWATETLHDEIQVALMDRQSRQVAEIEAALERLGRQEYGLCQDCEEFIGLARLQALPSAQRCTPCQSREELFARRETQPVSAGIAATEEDSES